MSSCWLSCKTKRIPILANSLEVEFVPGAEDPVAMTTIEVLLGGLVVVAVDLELKEVLATIMPLEAAADFCSLFARFFDEEPVRVTKAFSEPQVIFVAEKNESSLAPFNGML
jgi:hypothetical protein